eukprot:TRINITY_DN18300_c0_g1_i1.p1 TRINITY_DN18300_c0_g1~~TRINITY_DN18300_c0_g1_i1.p1  ORF type:complete len:387 (-),score=69.12 TRINITY_DN18300_c0_g1_i1:17-1177(-)
MKVRKFVEEEIKPYVADWIKDPKGYPHELHEKFYAAGIGGMMYPEEYGGTPPPGGLDPFYELIVVDELARGGGGGALGQAGINALALPPILAAGSEFIKNKVCRDVITGKKFISLAISEPYAGSDVAGLRTTAEKKRDHYIVNGIKKWITGGLMADYFTVAVRTGGPGMGGLSFLLMEKTMPGITIRKLETQFDNSHNTTFITFDDVKVPTNYLIGPENMGFMLIMLNFNHERFLIAANSCRWARMCYEEAFKYAMQRKTFGKRLIDHQIIRFKLAEMARMIEALYDNIERITFQFKCGVSDLKMGGQCALLKVNASKTFEYCAREASQIFGGASIIKEGKGKLVERLYREVRAAAIPGGSEEVLLDFTIRQAAGKAVKLAKAANL